MEALLCFNAVDSLAAAVCYKMHSILLGFSFFFCVPLLFLLLAINCTLCMLLSFGEGHKREDQVGSGDSRKNQRVELLLAQAPLWGRQGFSFSPSIFPITSPLPPVPCSWTHRMRDWHSWCILRHTFSVSRFLIWIRMHIWFISYCAPGMAFCALDFPTTSFLASRAGPADGERRRGD